MMKMSRIDGIGNGLPSMAFLVQIPARDLYMQHHLVANLFHPLNHCCSDQASRYRRVEKTTCRHLDLVEDSYSDYYVTGSNRQALREVCSSFQEHGKIHSILNRHLYQERAISTGLILIVVDSVGNNV
jgi:hypothetical protein